MGNCFLFFFLREAPLHHGKQPSARPGWQDARQQVRHVSEHLVREGAYQPAGSAGPVGLKTVPLSLESQALGITHYKYNNSSLLDKRTISF